MIEVEIKQGGEVRTVMLEHDEIIIGRRNEMREVQLDLTPDESVSRVHARAWLAGDKVFLEDLGSSGGSHVNGERLLAANLESKFNMKLGTDPLPDGWAKTKSTAFVSPTGFSFYTIESVEGALGKKIYLDFLIF